MWRNGWKRKGYRMLDKLLILLIILVLGLGGCAITTSRLEAPVSNAIDTYVETQTRIDPLEATSNALDNRQGSNSMAMFLFIVFVIFLLLGGFALAMVRGLPALLKAYNAARKPIKPQQAQLPQAPFNQPWVTEVSAPQQLPQPEQRLLPDHQNDDGGTQWLTIRD